MRRIPFKDERRIRGTTLIDPAPGGIRSIVLSVRPPRHFLRGASGTARICRYAPARTIRRLSLAHGTAASRHRLAVCKADYNAGAHKGQIKFSHLILWAHKDG